MGDRTQPAPSLLFRLLLGAGVALVLALALVGIAIDRAYQGAAEAAMKERLESVVYLILTAIELDGQGRPVMTDELAEPRLNQPGSSLHGGAMTPFGSWESPSLYGVEPQPNARVIERGRELFRGPEADGNWHVFAIGLGWEQPDGEIVDLTIWAAEDPNYLHLAISGFRADLGRWLGLAAVLIIAAQAVILLMLLRPLRQVAGEVREIESGRREGLAGRYPRELRPLTENLNALLQSERENARRYREALSDLAHALKTPVAVLRARLESQPTPEPGELAQSLAEMERLIRRQLERAARSTRQTIIRPVAVAPVLGRLADSLMRLHADRDLKIEIDADDDLIARVDERDLWELCGNLMENAAKYGRGRMRVRAEPGPAGPGAHRLALVVEDNGRGMDADQFAMLSQRGRRGDELGEGQGLGLGICRELAEAWGGRLELERSPLGGAAIRVILPAA